MIAWLVSPVGRAVAGGVAALLAVWLVWTSIEERGAERERARIERSNRDAERKADDARARSERESDAGRLREDDGFRR